jgi:NosR/NirI family nitrous oxide reductase transcriptional regulator
LPQVGSDGQSNIPGIYVVGELAGTPLVKLGLNAGHELMQRLGPELQSKAGADGDLYDVVIIGSGSSGLAATVAAKDLNLRYVTLDATAFANTFVTMMKGKWLFAEPLDVENKSRVWFEECTKEELLERWRAMVAEEELDVREHEKVLDINGGIDNFEVVSDSNHYRTQRVVLAMGKAGNPRKLGVSGEKENANRIHHRLLDADDYHNQYVTIVGAGDVACEAAIALATDPTNTVTLSAIDAELTFPKKRNVDAVRALEAEGKLQILLASKVESVAVDSVQIVKADGSSERLESNTLFEMIGAELPFGFFKSIGIKLNNEWDVRRWVFLISSFLFVYSLYAIKSYGKGLSAFPYQQLIDPTSYDSVLRSLFDVFFTPFAWLFSSEALADIGGDRGYQQGFLYSLLYTVLMAVFGYGALIRWRNKTRNGTYQTWRYISLISFQLVFFLIVNIVAVQAVSVKYAWRAWGLYQPFPLFFNTFFWWYPEDPMWIAAFFIGAGVLGTLVAIPILSRSHGKRFCTWVCGCGGLAETLGDRWRHLSPKGTRSRTWEFQAVAVLFASVIICLVVVGLYETDGNNAWWQAYSYLVDFWLVAVIPITLYPFFGGKVWCRYWCPLASYNQLLSKWYGKLKITSNDKCISCAECSKFCQVGVDVMAFAKNQKSFDNRNSSCIHCRICIDVCPMDVLAFDSSGNGKAKVAVTAV